ncbi:hypothetical protein RSSM_00844 [Rhodopirellula sallentina SM41]|uniref:Uncharacterized protein n=1 Tax=Rhodopirellula sallentina SM41 TaxID=1263870 RepID=M5U8I0_9BACT|nr:hypothetical protein RSSM_00844 [Rhodopirellula sallentina SM41]
MRDPFREIAHFTDAVPRSFNHTPEGQRRINCGLRSPAKFKIKAPDLATPWLGRGRA